MMPITDTVKQLLIINFLLFFGSLFVPNTYTYLCTYFIENPNFKLWQPLTHMFMHADFGHILFNMFGLYSFGAVLENLWGSKKFLFFYISCGLGAFLIQMGVNYFQFHSVIDFLVFNGIDKAEIYNALASGEMPNSWIELMGQNKLDTLINSYYGRSLGASGAIYGLLAAFAYLFPNVELSLLFVPVPIKAKIFIPILIAIDLFAGLGAKHLGGTNIAHFAHVGGALVGILIVLYWKKNQFNNYRWDK